MPSLDEWTVVFAHLDARSLGRAAQVCRWSRDLARPLIPTARLREGLVERISKMTLHPEGDRCIFEVAFWGDRLALTCRGAPDPWVIDRVDRSSRPLPGHEGPTGCVVAWGDLLVTGSYDKTARLWDETGTCVAVLRGHERAVHRLIIWGDLLVTTSHDDTVRLWTKEGTCIGRVQLEETINHMTRWNDGLVIAVTAAGVLLWDKASARSCVLRVPDPPLMWDYKTRASCVAVWRDLLAIGSFDGLIRLWDRAGSLVNVLAKSASVTEYVKSWIVWTDRGGHENAVTCLVAWGELLVSGSADGTMRFWSEEGECIRTWRFPDGFPTCLAARDGELAVGLRNGIVHIYGVPE